MILKNYIIAEKIINFIEVVLTFSLATEFKIILAGKRSMGVALELYLEDLSHAGTGIFLKLPATQRWYSRKHFFPLLPLLCFGAVSHNFVVKCYLVYLLVIPDKKN